MKATLVKVKHLRSNIQMFWFRPDSRLRFEPGQFVELYVPHENTDSRGDHREFSICSTPEEELVAITVNFFENGSSFKHTLRSLKPGDKVTMAEPMGDFVLPKDPSVPLLFVAAGLGCTPYVSMVKWLSTRSDKRYIKLIYAVSHREDFLFEDLWRSYPIEYIPLLARPVKEWPGQSGRLTAQTILENVSNSRNQLIYLAGPQSLIEPLYNSLLDSGIPRRQLLLDYFPGY